MLIHTLLTCARSNPLGGYYRISTYRNVNTTEQKCLLQQFYVIICNRCDIKYRIRVK